MHEHASPRTWQCRGVTLASVKEEDRMRRLRVLLVSDSTISIVKGWPYKVGHKEGVGVQEP